MTNADSNLMEPSDIENLKEQLQALKKELNLEREEKVQLKAKNEQYKKRAIYCKNKFFEVKSKGDKIAEEASMNSES